MTALLKAYERGLDVALKFRFVTLMVFFAFLALSVYLFVAIPKGFFPQQDTGQINGISQAAQDASFAEMAQRQVALGAIVLKDPGRRARRDVDRRHGQRAQRRAACSSR